MSTAGGKKDKVRVDIKIRYFMFMDI